MDWITDRIAIGNYLDAKDSAQLKQLAVRSVLSLDGTLSASHAIESGLAEVASYRLIDGAGNDLRLFRYAVEDLRRLANLFPPVLVQCHAGRSRSAVVVAAYLMLDQGMSPERAIAAVVAKREINVTEGLIEMLYSLEA